MMSWYTCLSMLILFATGVSAINNSGTMTHAKIIGGRHVHSKYFTKESAFLLAMMDEEEYICGASILSTKFVLTAAHCTFGINASQLSFRAGTRDRSSGGMVFKAVRILQHPRYLHEELDYDVAIVEVYPKIHFGKKVRKVDIAVREPKVGSVVTASGWGIMEECTKNKPRILRSVQILTVDRTLCQRLYSKQDLEITDRMMCAGFLSKTGKKDTCSGDSGGPLTYAGKLVGVISWGYGCGRTGYPGIYTNINHKKIRMFIKYIANV